MIYFKSILAGLVGAVLAALLMLVLEAAAFVLLASVGRGLASTGSGGIAWMLFPTIPILVFAAAGFVAGFWWTYRKRAV
jgi:hypothetical protein